MAKRVVIENAVIGSGSDDMGRFVSIELSASGNTPEELLETAHVYEVDQDGGSIRDYPLGACSAKMVKAGVAAIEWALDRAFQARLEGRP